MVGPYDRIHDEGESLATFRTIGFRKRGRNRPPIAHAKLALLGNICWTDEHPAGGVDEYLWFSPQRLWVSSANFTYGSRKLMEHGFWTEERHLIEGVHRFLVGLIAASEDIDSEADDVDPELAYVEFDDAAMREALAEQRDAQEEWEALADEDVE
jgi:hypothetical protein